MRVVVPLVDCFSAESGKSSGLLERQVAPREGYTINSNPEAGSGIQGAAQPSHNTDLPFRLP